MFGSARISQGDAVQKCYPCVIATADAVETIIEDPLLPVLKQDSNITKAAGQVRRPRLGNHPTSPRFKLFMINLVPHSKVSVLPWVAIPF